MKQLIIIFLSTLGLLFSSIQAAGENPPTKTVPVKKEKKEKTDPDPRLFHLKILDRFEKASIL